MEEVEGIGKALTRLGAAFHYALLGQDIASFGDMAEPTVSVHRGKTPANLELDLAGLVRPKPLTSLRKLRLHAKQSTQTHSRTSA